MSLPVQGTMSHDLTESRFRLRHAYLLALASLAFNLGVAWDVQWHADVGPDSFFTAPHALIYFGATVFGLVSLYGVLATTRRYRSGAPGVTDETTTPWLGRFRAPVGFVIAGLGAVAFLLSGGYDMWWHEIYGFDITLFSPPHFGLILGGVVSMVGAIYAFASESNRAEARGETDWLHPARLGFLLSLALLMVPLSLFLFVTLDNVAYLGPVNANGLFAAAFTAMVLLTAASLLRRPGSATAVAVLITLLRLLMLYAAPFATQLQADLAGLPFRPGAPGFSLLAFAMPAYAVVAGLAIDLGLWALRRAGLGWRPALWLSAAAAGILNFLLDPRWLRWLDSMTWLSPQRRTLFMAEWANAFVPSLAAVALGTALFGWLGWSLGTALRYTDK